jgi:hypothetical protein
MRRAVPGRRLATFAASLSMLAGAATSHPVDELIQGAYLTLAPGEVRLDLDLTPGAEVLPLVSPALDPDADGSVTEAEARAYAEDVLGDSKLLLNEEAVAWTLVGVTVPDPTLLAAGSGVIRIEATAARPDREGIHVLTYETHHEPAKSLWMANVFLRPGEGWTYAVNGQERSDKGRSLTVTFEAKLE